MKRIFMLLFGVMLLSANIVSAEEATPFLKSANLEVTYEDVIKVTEKITIANSEAIPEGTLEHIVTKIGGEQFEDLVINGEGQELTYELNEGNSVDRVLLSIPAGSKGEFTYTVTYQYSDLGNEKIPFVVPAVNAAGNGNVVSLNVNLPKGKYLHESFPIIDSGDSGMVKEDMMNIPSYVNLETGSSPAGLFTTSNLYTFFGLAVILGIILAWIISERKSKGGEVVNV
ncbi:hypothetical protein QFZ28_006081 [Neobacillus niacini]|uniref:hypothetical protein n=1 Tax=Neobacillus niacini TaxID=86668 RepID=UPI0027859AF6|nr:hypothetical protein [Neobacillus niacini]MDQ1005503.1 hypothetical protein [Neobacillus niacini]